MKNLRLKIILWKYVVFPVVGFIIVLIFSELELVFPEVIPGLEIDKSLLGEILAGVTFGFWVSLNFCKLMSLRCPKCNRALYSFIRLFAFEFARKKCRNCGYDLRGRDSEKEARVM